MRSYVKIQVMMDNPGKDCYNEIDMNCNRVDIVKFGGFIYE